MNSVARAKKMKKAFTLLELVVSIALLGIVFLFAGVIFRVSIDAYRTAAANAEIMQKLRAITDQLNADFKGLRKDGEIFVVWVTREIDAAAAAYDGYHDCDNDGYERFDRIMFFADGDFQSYSASPKVIRGNTARICYMLAKTKDESGGWKGAEDYREPTLISGREEEGRKLREEDRRGRILSRTQHILTADPDPCFSAFVFTPTPPDQDWFDWNNKNEYEKMPLADWTNMPQSEKQNALSVITDIRVTLVIPPPNVKKDVWGTQVDPADANTIHNLLCEGVGEFKVQGWFDAGKRWVPEVDPNENRDLTDDSDFILDGNDVDPCAVPGVLYPYRVMPPPDEPNGMVILNDDVWDIDENNYYRELLNETRFNEIPGLGRALKFTFTLYDSKGIIKQGRTFTHIVYLEN
jgi:prepilin-type N-terminal cleavage/methylation domain-containing protein